MRRIAHGKLLILQRRRHSHAIDAERDLLSLVSLASKTPPLNYTEDRSGDLYGPRKVLAQITNRARMEEDEFGFVTPAGIKQVFRGRKTKRERAPEGRSPVWVKYLSRMLQRSL